MGPSRFGFLGPENGLLTDLDQLNFVDHTKLILTSAARTLRLVTSNNELHVLSLEEAYERCTDGNDTLATEFALKQKMGYVKEILRAWYKTGRFPGDIEGDGAAAVILGEGPPPV